MKLSPLLNHNRRLGYTISSGSSSSSSSSQSSESAPNPSTSSGSHSSSSSSSSNSNTNSSGRNPDASASYSSGSSSSSSSANTNSSSASGDNNSGHTNVFAHNEDTSNKPEDIDNISNGALTVPHSTQVDINEDHHENQAPKKATVCSCRSQNDPRVNSMAVDVTYQYELIIARDVSNTEALLGVEESIMRDLSDAMGCTQLSNLRRMEESKVVGFQWFDGDHVDIQCTGEANDPLLTCTPTQAQFTAFLEPETSIEVVDEMKNIMLSTIRDGMSNDRYTSDSVNQVIFANLDELTSDTLQTLSGNDEERSNEKNQVSVQSTNTTNSGFPGYAILATVFCFFAIVIGLYLVKRSRKNRNVAPNNRKRKSAVSFAHSLEEEIPTGSCHSSSFGSRSS